MKPKWSPEFDLTPGAHYEQYDADGRRIEAWTQGRRRSRRDVVEDIGGWLALNDGKLSNAEIKAGIEAADLNSHEAGYAKLRAREMVAELKAGETPLAVAEILRDVPKKYRHLPPMPWLEKRREEYRALCEQLASRR